MKKVLVVDDDSAVLAFIRDLLIKNSYQVFSAPDGKEALELASREKPDLILLDILMPQMDGRDVLAKLKQSEGTKDIPVIFLTGKQEQFDRDYGLQLGAREYITKPCDSQLILRQIANILRVTPSRKT